MTAMHPASLPIDELLKSCEVRRTRRSGPGGQHRNKVETAIEIRHLPTDVSAEASERRSQEQNRRVAIQRLRVNLALAFRSEPLEQPSERWRARTANQRISIATEHDDFPAILAEALDQLDACDSEKTAAERLAVSVSQLVKLLKREPAALQWLNRRREERGLRPLR